MTSLTRILAATDSSAHARQASQRAALVNEGTATRLDRLPGVKLAPVERLRQFVDITPGQRERRVLGTARQRFGDLEASHHQRHGVVAGTFAVAGSVLAEPAKEAGGHAACLLVGGAVSAGKTKARVAGAAADPALRPARRVRSACSGDGGRKNDGRSTSSAPGAAGPDPRCTLGAVRIGRHGLLDLRFSAIIGACTRLPSPPKLALLPDSLAACACPRCGPAKRLSVLRRPQIPEPGDHFPPTAQTSDRRALDNKPARRRASACGGYAPYL